MNDEKENTFSDSNSTSIGVGLNSSCNLIFENLKWLTSREAVVYLRLPSVGALRNLVYRRRIPFARLGRSLRFDRAALDRFIESSEIKRRIK